MKALNHDERSQAIMNAHSQMVSRIIDVMNCKHLTENGSPLWTNKHICGTAKIDYPFVDILSTNPETGVEVRTSVTIKSPWYDKNFCVQVGKYDVLDAMYVTNNIFDYVDYFAFVTPTHVYFVPSKTIKDNFEKFTMKEDEQRVAKFLLVPLDFIVSNSVRKLAI